MAESQEEKKASRTTTARNRRLYVGSLIILIIVVVSFVGAPIISTFGGGGQMVFGSYAGEEIRYQPGNFFARQYEAIAQSLRDSGQTADLDLQLRIAWREAFNRTVLHTAILHQAAEAGMDVSSQRVDELIASDPRFQSNGRFDSAAYERIGSQERFSLRNFHRESAIFDQFVTDVLTGAKTAANERSFVAQMSGPERSFNVVRFPFSDFPDAQVRAFAEENSQLFTELDLAVVTLENQEEAQQIRDQALQPGNPIGDLARTYSRDLYADQEGEIGRIYAYELQQEMINPDDVEALSALEPGEISDPIETTAGWAFYEALAPSESVDLSQEETLQAVRSYLQNFEQGRIQDYVQSEAERFTQGAEAEGFAEFAEAESRDLLTTPFFPINYGDLQLFGRLESSQIPELSDAAYRESFFETAFSLAEDAVSEPIALRRSVLVMQLREERPARESDIAFIDQYYDTLLREFRSDEIESAFINDDLLQDNFAQAFNRYVTGTN
ncbi:MAG: SurA N-terminal domain-containing protein [Alkalispirochaeta sp.]